MRQKSGTRGSGSEKLIRTIKRKTQNDGYKNPIGPAGFGEAISHHRMHDMPRLP